MHDCMSLPCCQRWKAMASAACLKALPQGMSNLDDVWASVCFLRPALKVPAGDVYDCCLCHVVVMPAGDWCGSGRQNVSWSPACPRIRARPGRR